MCGISGRVELAGGIAPVDGDRLALDAIRHRGPDDEGQWYGAAVCLGMRRLSVIDLNTGHQPVFNEDRSVAVVYNGEIYNFQDVRRELESHGHRFATASDTEVIAHGWEQWGEGIAERLNGMFAFAVADERQQVVWVVRDRVGIKPLYYLHEPGRRLLFASEIKALLAHAGVAREVDDEGLLNFLAYGHAVAPATMYKGVRKLMPGHSLRIERGQVAIRRWWQPTLREDRSVPEVEWERQIRALLEDSVRRQMVADVPVGAFLSGGVDSSTVVALMTRNTGHRVQTFAVGFDHGREFNELPDARRVAQHLGTEHHELLVRPSQLVDVLQTLVYHFDEPFGDAACFPTYLVSRLARQHVTVALTGEGGDELFGGYRRYRAGAWMRTLGPLLAAGHLGLAPVAAVVPRLRRLKKLAEAAATTDPVTRYSQFLRVFSDDLLARVVADRYAASARRFDAVAPYRRLMSESAGADHMNQLMFADLMTWLPDTYLEKVDKSSMAVSLEARVPLLDHRLVELSLRIPARFKMSGGVSKRILKRAVADLLPPETLTKPKHGFAVPTDPWFRGELRQFAYDVLLDPRTRQRGYFRPEAVERLWREHQSGREVRDAHLWLLLNFELWARRYLDAQEVKAA
ncbi:MAG: asparagine synthase (glutamine-hydrolyzing) [Vicinamibacterales bacterium]